MEAAKGSDDPVVPKYAPRHHAGFDSEGKKLMFGG